MSVVSDTGSDRTEPPEAIPRGRGDRQAAIVVGVALMAFFVVALAKPWNGAPAGVPSPAALAPIAPVASAPVATSAPVAVDGASPIPESPTFRGVLHMTGEILIPDWLPFDLDTGRSLLTGAAEGADLTNQTTVRLLAGSGLDACLAAAARTAADRPVAVDPRCPCSSIPLVIALTDGRVCLKTGEDRLVALQATGPEAVAPAHLATVYFTWDRPPAGRSRRE